LSVVGTTYYYPSLIDTPHTQYFGPGSAVSTLVPVGRTYWIPIEPTEAIHWTHHGVTASLAGGVVELRTVRQAVEDLSKAGGQALPTLVLGENEVAFYYFNTFYPGEAGHLWMQVDIISGSPRLMSVLGDLAPQAYYSDDDGATILPLPEHIRRPVVFLRSDS
jgi:hypothetical protein